MSQLILWKEDLRHLFHRFQAAYRVIGPVAADGVVGLGKLESLSSLPIGHRDRQGPGVYRLKNVGDAESFSFAVGPDSVKRFLHPPVQHPYTFRKSRKRPHIASP